MWPWSRQLLRAVQAIVEAAERVAGPGWINQVYCCIYPNLARNVYSFGKEQLERSVQCVLWDAVVVPTREGVQNVGGRGNVRLASDLYRSGQMLSEMFGALVVGATWCRRVVRR